MLVDIKQRSLSRRGSKLMVEAIIGVIGILGIMLAQLETSAASTKMQQLNEQVVAIGSEVKSSAKEIDWLEILFF